MTGSGGWNRLMFDKWEEQRPEISSPETPARPERPWSFADDHNDFALALYRHLLQRPRNLFFSPFSIRSVLGMAYAGARGETAAQMRLALHFASSDEPLHAAFAEITSRLRRAGGGKYEMAVASSLWGQDGAPVRPEFLDLVARHHDGGMNVVDFRRGAEVARAAINGWVQGKTNQIFRELIAPGALNGDTRLVAVNAVYFQGRWVLQFPEAATRDEPFYLQGSGVVRAPLMHQHEEVRYLRGRDFQAVDLDYQGDDLSMLVLLPDRKDGLPDLEARLSARMLHDSVANMRVHGVKLFLPRFKMNWGPVELDDPLRALGMPLAFTPLRADFSGINGREPPHEDSLFLSRVLHNAYVKVNEEGTEAAAATAAVEFIMGLSRKPLQDPIFRADHPFLFAIRDRKSGAILFLGRVADPTQES